MSFNRQDEGRPMRQNGVKRTKDKKPDGKKGFGDLIKERLENQRVTDEKAIQARDDEEGRFVEYGVYQGKDLLKFKRLDQAERVANSINSDVWLILEGSFVNKM